MIIEFISYDGQYPNLCSGLLTLMIDGAKVTFGLKDIYDSDYDPFWRSGGKIVSYYGESCVREGEWKLEEENLPSHLRPFGKELIRIFNENVEWGCCGGCL